MTFTIRKQRYPTHTGAKPLSFAIYLSRGFRSVFLAYSWSYEGARLAIKEITR